MRVAIFSDVHGNADALEVVLERIKQQGELDKIIFAGDLVYGAHQPAKCIELIRENEIACVYGNTDEFFWVDQEQHERASDEEWQNYLDYMTWAKERIGDDGLSFMAQMPFKQIIAPTDNKENDLLVVHANPRNVQTLIFPSPEIQEDKIGRVIQSDTDVFPLIENVTEKTIAFGHIHMPNIRMVETYKLVNIASVSRPQDEDWRSKYAILTFSDDGWSVEHHYVEYDVATTKKELLNSGMPEAEQFAKSLKLP